ncbi:MAG: YgiQ family radical SAM protein, partial [Prevotellaceae bacterium]|nr:YgiQ family radical SAM protein [Prevotellaceae bacterium]
MNPANRLSSGHLPTSKKEMDYLGWEQADVIFFSGDAYIDHPAFGTAVIARVLENRGLKVAIVPQPNWQDDLRDFKKLGTPKLFFAVNAGVMDSMVNRYTANKRTRSDDAYTPGGRANARPDRAVTVYSQILKKLYPDIPVVIGGIEASLRRLTHYDFWDDALKPSVLIDSGADYLVYGQGEKAIIALAGSLMEGNREAIFDIPQITFAVPQEASDKFTADSIFLHSYEQCLKDKDKFGENFKIIETESNTFASKRLLENCGEKTIVVNPPYTVLNTDEIDEIYDLPYTRLPHPRYNGKTVPAYEMIKHSINIHRGCFGGCSFCTISAHQGKFIASRSEKSILDEVDKVVNMPDFKGHISDLGGPAANMYRMEGKNKRACTACKRASCLFPKICANLNANHTPLLDLYSTVRKYPKVKMVSIGSGIRYDMFLNNNGFIDEAGRKYFETVMKRHVSGRLKVAPEHTSGEVLKSVRKPPFELFVKLKSEFDKLNRQCGYKKQLIPYFISGLPHCKENDMKQLAAIMSRMGYKLEQVQSFTPTPMTLASTIFYTGKDPYSGEKVYVAKSNDERKNQQKYFFKNPHTGKRQQ